MTNIVHVVAYDKAGCIGKGDLLLPWVIKEDMKHFKELTTGHAIVMGRKTFASIGRPLPNRKNIVVTRTPQLIKQVEAVCNIESAVDLAMDYARKHNQDRIFIIGGAQIYKHTSGIVDEVYATLVEGTHDGDRFYQLPNGMEQVSCSGAKTDGKETYYFKHYKRAAF